MQAVQRVNSGPKPLQQPSQNSKFTGMSAFLCAVPISAQKKHLPETDKYNKEY